MPGRGVPPARTDRHAGRAVVPCGRPWPRRRTVSPNGSTAWARDVPPTQRLHRTAFGLGERMHQQARRKAQRPTISRTKRSGGANGPDRVVTVNAADWEIGQGGGPCYRPAGQAIADSCRTAAGAVLRRARPADQAPWRHGQARWRHDQRAFVAAPRSRIAAWRMLVPPAGTAAARAADRVEGSPRHAHLRAAAPTQAPL